MGRSKNPDLIFEDVLEERANRIGSQYYKGGFHTGYFNLDRVTLFVTHRCNLFCEYCNGPHTGKPMDEEERKKMLHAEITLEQYTKLMDDWGKFGLKHIHFTGGEATLNKSLPDFVKLASEKNVLSSLTTNGTADFDLYKKLVENGLTEIRVSLDSAVDEEFDKIAGANGTCRKTKENITNLVKLKENYNDLFIIINACVGTSNIDNIRQTMESLIELNPDDIKFLVIAEQGKQVCSRASRDAVDELLEYMKTKNKHYELLEKKIKAMFRKDSFGLQDASSQHEIRKCFVPLTERTVDARGFYPCSIYLRYKAAPIASIDSAAEDQQIAINRFVETHSCREDDICKKYCTNCCKEFNLAVNRKIHAQIELDNAYESEAIRIEPVTPEEVQLTIATYNKIKQQVPANSLPFIIIKPQGIHFETEIKNYLRSQSISIVNEKHIENWQLYSLFLYLKNAEGKSAEFKIARNRAFALFEPENKGRFLLLSSEEDIPEKKLFRIKHELRHWHGEHARFFYYNGQNYVLKSNCVHVPNYRDLEMEHKIAKFFLGS